MPDTPEFSLYDPPVFTASFFVKETSGYYTTKRRLAHETNNFNDN